VSDPTKHIEYNIGHSVGFDKGVKTATDNILGITCGSLRKIADSHRKRNARIQPDTITRAADIIEDTLKGK